jgi:hypothetical protein
MGTHTPSKVQRGTEVIDRLSRVENDFTTCSHFQVSSSLSLSALAPFSINITRAASPIYSQVSCNLIAG